MTEDNYPKSLVERYQRVIDAGLYGGSLDAFAAVEHLIYKVSNKSEISLKAWLKMLKDAEEDKGSDK